MVNPIPHGVWPVMLTPFHTDRSIDWNGLDALIEWYLAAGVAGLFAVCASSEMYELEADERLALARHVVRRVGGRVPVLASGTFGGTIEAQAANVRATAATGVDAVVVLVCQLAAQQEDDRAWIAQAERLLALTAGIPLGLYECPSPYKRLLDGEALAWVAKSERFLFLKDTTCSTAAIAAKLAVLPRETFGLYNANTPTLLDTLQLGAAGFCGIGANFYARLYVWLCAHYQREPEQARRLQHLLGVGDMVVRHKYPASAKLFLRSCGVPIGPTCRTANPSFEEEELSILAHLAGLSQEMAATQTTAAALGI